MDKEITNIINQIHSNPEIKGSLVVTGCGSNSLSWLLSVAGASKTKLTTYVPYSKKSLEVFTEKLTKISAITTSIGTVISTVLALIFPIKGKITSLNGVIESFYLKHTLMCDVEGESMEDEAYAAAVNEAQNSLNSTLSNEDAEITFIEEDLQPNTIERIRNANFEVIQYRIA